MKAWAFAVLELNCKPPEFWDLTPDEYSALVDHWRIKMERDGFKVKRPDTHETRKADQAALAAALKLIPKHGAG